MNHRVHGGNRELSRPSLASARPAARWRHVGAWGWAGQCWLPLLLLVSGYFVQRNGPGCCDLRHTRNVTVCPPVCDQGHGGRRDSHDPALTARSRLLIVLSSLLLIFVI